MGASDAICSLAFSPDGLFLAVAGDEPVTLWHLRTFAPYPVVPRPGFYSSSRNLPQLGFSPDSKMLVVAEQNTLLCVEVATRKVRHKFEVCEEGDFTLALSPDGKSLATGGDLRDPSLKVWDMASGKQRMAFKHAAGHIRCLAFSKDGRFIMSGHSAGDVWVWDTATGKQVCALKSHCVGIHDSIVRSIAVSDDGKLLATCGDDETVKVYRFPRLTRDVTEKAPVQNPPPVNRLSVRELEARWADLAGADAGKAYQVIHSLAAAPAESIALFQQQLRPVPVTDEVRLGQLIADLDSSAFATRQEATEELTRLGEQVEALLEKALAGKPSLEVRSRLEKLLARLREPLTPGDKLRTLRALEVLEAIGTTGAIDLLRSLAAGDPDALVSRQAKDALQRLARRLPSGDQ